MITISDHDVRKGMNDFEFFKTLEPGQMMYVLVSDLIAHGDMKKMNFEHWITQEKRWPEVSMEDRMDQVIRVLESYDIVRSLQAFQKSGFMRFCLPRCFPIKKLMDKKNFYDIIDHMDRMDIRRDDTPFKLAILMFPFDPDRTWETLRDANIAKEDRDWITNLIDYYMEFIRLNNPKKLKNFIARFGKDFYFDMNDYAQQILKITKMDELKPLESYSFVTRWIRKGIPLDLDDLALTEEDVVEAGSESDEETMAVRRMLLEHVLKYPEDNEKEILLARIRNMTQKEIDRKVRQLRKEARE